ncbi:hypothetical protein BDK51DRAFT_49295 [Blyttiomyces helicus]|uniref:Uncharacterized protein n=1 Tax=Blyttiomyces helicus TaxID=388810 RepID=A0A4P9WA96_9FUNG|nr:hypothetical protein BDK51DRAFT_49295 [Blyttiomyces helicus]|eukprot:RKO89132.1 hypothetical protein BDK51DRAFT_49295 [Blyttiomyces helicus]
MRARGLLSASDFGLLSCWGLPNGGSLSPLADESSQANQGTGSVVCSQHPGSSLVVVLPFWPPSRIFIITFDEESGSDGGGGQIYTLLAGKPVPALAGTTDGTTYDLYSLLRTIEDNFQAGTLGRNDDSATAIAFN